MLSQTSELAAASRNSTDVMHVTTRSVKAMVSLNALHILFSLVVVRCCHGSRMEHALANNRRLSATIWMMMLRHYKFERTVA
mmetsp:Transcript_37478/g.74337  ORF Transcript_37478/g.74337 Transcript_37478/m.74337 type:complete len:82 (-) Transcript_37478:96-341(-)